jgi:flagellar basal-body rod protein FlgB
MLIDSVFNNTGTEVLDRMTQFTETRHQILANDLANIDTPDYKMQDLNAAEFQQDLKKAIDNRSLTADSSSSSSDSTDLESKTDYTQYLLFHDGNNRSPEKLITQMTSNTIMHNVSVELLRNRYSLLEKAISLQP